MGLRRVGSRWTGVKQEEGTPWHGIGWVAKQPFQSLLGWLIDYVDDPAITEFCVFGAPY